MTVTVAYSSRSGNTRKVAQALAEGIGAKAEAVAEVAQAAGLVFVGFWCDKGMIDEGAKAMLGRIAPGSAVAMFGTMGGNPASERAQAWLTKVVGEAAAAHTDLHFEKPFLCQGAIAQDIIEAMNRMPGVNPDDPVRKARLAQAAQHPDEADFAAVRSWAAAIAGERK